MFTHIGLFARAYLEDYADRALRVTVMGRSLFECLELAKRSVVIAVVASLPASATVASGYYEKSRLQEARWRAISTSICTGCLPSGGSVKLVSTNLPLRNAYGVAIGTFETKSAAKLAAAPYQFDKRTIAARTPMKRRFARLRKLKHLAYFKRQRITSVQANRDAREGFTEIRAVGSRNGGWTILAQDLR